MSERRARPGLAGAAAAVGCGAAAALVSIDRDLSAEGRPNIAVARGLRTENGTRGLSAGHLGTWMDNRLRTLVGVADADVKLDFFGLGGDRDFQRPMLTALADQPLGSTLCFAACGAAKSSSDGTRRSMRVYATTR